MMKQRKPRKSKKSIRKRGVLIYDLAVLPKNWTLIKVMTAFKQDGIVIYNLTAAGNFGMKNTDNTPIVINNARTVKFIDLSQKSDDKTGG